MAAYTIINATASALDSGGATTAAYTIETGITLSDANLAVVAALDGVAVMQDAPTTAEKNSVGNLIVGGSGAAPGSSYRVFNGGGALTDINAAGDDVAAYSTSATVALTAVELKAVLLAGVAASLATSTDEQKRKLSRIISNGALSGVVT